MADKLTNFGGRTLFDVQFVEKALKVYRQGDSDSLGDGTRNAVLKLSFSASAASTRAVSLHSAGEK